MELADDRRARFSTVTRPYSSVQTSTCLTAEAWFGVLPLVRLSLGSRASWFARAGITSDHPHVESTKVSTLTRSRLLRVCSLRLAVLVYGELYDDKRNNKNAYVTPIRSGRTHVTADRYRQGYDGSNP